MKEDMKLTKAKQTDISELFRMAWNHESMEGDASEKRRLVAFAQEHQLTHLLPGDAHGMMHDMNIPHNHDGVDNDDESGLHQHTVVKAFTSTGEVVKSWVDGDTAFWEGWLSTPRKDEEKDVTEPEAFLDAGEGYFALRAPVSIQHGLNYIPIGHLQAGAVVRDGKILKSFKHPTDPAEFEYFPGTGSGVWVRGVANEPIGRDALRKGNVGGMSFSATAAAKEKLPGGRYRYTKLDPWMESTVAPYPINPDARIAVIKAHPEKETPAMTKTLEEIMAAALAEREAQTAVDQAKNITIADLGSILGEFKTGLLGEVGTEIMKAFNTTTTAQTAEGVGRRGTVAHAPSDERDTDPAAYLIKKAASPTPEWDDTDKELISRLTIQALLQGLE